MRSSIANVRLTSESFQSRSSKLTQDTIASLQAIWAEAGYEEIECQGLLGDLFNKLKDICSAELTAEMDILEHAKNEVEIKKDHFFSLCAQLGRDGREYRFCGSNIADKLAELEKATSVVSTEVSSRQQALNLEYASLRAASLELGEPIPELDSFSGPAGTPVLSDLRLTLLKQHSAELVVLRENRVAQLIDLCGQCASLARSLLLSPVHCERGELATKITDDRGREVIQFVIRGCADPSIARTWPLSVHRDYLSATEDLRDVLTKEVDSRKRELVQTGAEIARLWTLLRIPTAEREQFQSSFEANLSEKTLTAGRAELARLKDIRTTSLVRVIASIRKDIQQLWNELDIRDEAKKMDEFESFYDLDEHLDDSSVEEHENYYIALKARVEELRPLLQKISRREGIVQERIELEHIQLNPERLTARGPNAREDRKREEAMTLRVRGLEKLTKEISSSIHSWEEKNGIFVYGGERYLDRMSSQEEYYIEIRDSLRNARKKKDGKPELTPSKVAPKRVAISGSAATLAGSLSALKVHAKDHATPSSAPITASALADLENSNGSYNYGLTSPAPRDWHSHRDSDCTAYTSATEVRDRESSATLVRGAACDHDPEI